MKLVTITQGKTGVKFEIQDHEPMISTDTVIALSAVPDFTACEVRLNASDTIFLIGLLKQIWEDT